MSLYPSMLDQIPEDSFVDIEYAVQGAQDFTDWDDEPFYDAETLALEVV